MLYTGALDDQLGHSILTAGAVTLAAPVVLAGRLPGNAKPRSDLWPPDAHADRLIHQHREFGICLLPVSLARSIRSSTSGGDSWESRCGGPDNSARSWGRCLGCTCLTFGRRLDLLT